MFVRDAKHHYIIPNIKIYFQISKDWGSQAPDMDCIYSWPYIQPANLAVGAYDTKPIPESALRAADKAPLVLVKTAEEDLVLRLILQVHARRHGARCGCAAWPTVRQVRAEEVHNHKWISPKLWNDHLEWNEKVMGEGKEIEGGSSREERHFFVNISWKSKLILR